MNQNDLIYEWLDFMALQKSCKKTIKEARNLGLTYVGGNQYANSQGQVTHLAENGYLVELNKD